MYRGFLILARAGTVLALVVVTVGAWVRLTDAGLGCPDWPTCYGELTVPTQLSASSQADPAFAARPELDADKAWNEMFHRYLASTLGLVCVALAGLAWLNRKDPRQPLAVPIALVGLVILQGLLGMWTVTLLLKPIVVVGHLAGGFATLALLFWLSRIAVAPFWPSRSLKFLSLLATGALVIQIFLGGWTSANYAAIACPDFPTCQTQWWPEIADFDEAFVLWRGIGTDYEGGVLEHPARVAIHFTHRLGAVVATVLIGLFVVGLLRKPSSRSAGQWVLAALALQVGIGISVVVFGAPLPVAVAHNGVAALLLLTLINADTRIWQN